MAMTGWKKYVMVAADVMFTLLLSTAAFALDDQVLAQNFRDIFKKRNPALVNIQVLGSKRLSNRTTDVHVYLVRAIRADNKFEGRFEDEQFGVFLVDINKSQVTTILDVFNTPRWNDYQLKIERVSSSKVTVNGRGATYGDQPITKTYMVRETR